MTSKDASRYRYGIAAGLAILATAAAVQPLGHPGQLRSNEAGVLLLLAVTSALPALLWKRRRARGWPIYLGALMIASALLLWCRSHLLPFTMESRYVEAQDGTALAVDIYLPRALPKVTLPTILAQTRYLRSIQSAFPYSILLSPASGLAATLTDAGFAYVVADVRGTGASEGRWPAPWAEDEIADGATLVDWIVSQPWSNGRVGAHGISYVGTSAEFLLSNKHPAVLGAVVAFSLYDGFDDIVMPGGLWLHSFNESWQRTNSLLDSNRPADVRGMSPRLLAGVTPTDDDAGGTRLRAIVAARDNGSLLERLRSLSGFRATQIEDGWRLHSSHDLQQQINDSGAAILGVSGWLDGAYADAAIKRLLNGTNVKLLIGPWDHGGRQNASPCEDDGAQSLDYGELVVDFHRSALAGAGDTEYAQSPPIRYFTLCNVNGNGWRTASRWPPAETEFRDFALGSNGSLGGQATAGTRIYRMNLTTSSAKYSRWFSYTNVANYPIGYPDRAERDKALLIYEGEPQELPLTITGNPLLNLRMSIADGSDAAVFAYLEDVGPDGDVRYITEGQLRAALRPVADSGDELYRDTGPHHLFRKGDFSPLVPGEPVDLQIGLLPVSYTVRPGRRLRLAIAGADAVNFSEPEGAASQWQIKHGRSVSWLQLPVTEPGAESSSPEPKLSLEPQS